MPNLGPTEVILIIFVLVLLFGAKKLPELARGSGRALRIFKSETKGLMDENDDDVPRTSGSTSTQAQISPTATTTATPPQIVDPTDGTIAPPPPAQMLPPTHTERDR
ncbi:MAG: Sec-independent protein translocase subunit TatA [Nocardioidaceae bacterium]|nr:Sec-independent protein translocase subunit TatA [Nocardioidaceae bacterium]